MRIGPRRFTSIIKKFFIVLRFNLTKSEDLSRDWHWKNYDRGTFSRAIAVVGELWAIESFFFPQFKYEEKYNANLQAVNRVLSHSNMNHKRKVEIVPAVQTTFESLNCEHLQGTRREYFWKQLPLNPSDERLHKIRRFKYELSGINNAQRFQFISCNGFVMRTLLSFLSFLSNLPKFNKICIFYTLVLGNGNNLGYSM